MDPQVGRLPPGIELGPLSREVFDILAEHTAFPWPVLLAQALRIGADAPNLLHSDLERLAPRLADGVARFTSPDKGESVRARILALRDS